MKNRKKAGKTPRRNPFIGAAAIFLTKSKIVVTTTTNTKAKRGFTQVKKTKYYEQNAANLRQLKAATGGTVRVGRKGNNYRVL